MEIKYGERFLGQKSQKSTVSKTIPRPKSKYGLTFKNKNFIA